MRLFSLFLLLGTLLIQWLTQLPSWRIVLVCLIVSLVISLTRFFLLKDSKDRSRNIERLFISISAFLLGLFLASYHASTILSNRISPEAEGQELIITGKIIGIPAVRDDGVRFLMDVTRAKYAEASQLAEGSQLADGSYKSTNLKGIVRLGWFQQAEELKSGETWHLKVKLKRPSGFMNPGGFVAL